MALVADDTFYILRFDRDAYAAALDSGVEVGDEGVEAAFEVMCEITDA